MRSPITANTTGAGTTKKSSPHNKKQPHNDKFKKTSLKPKYNKSVYKYRDLSDRIHTLLDEVEGSVSVQEGGSGGGSGGGGENSIIIWNDYEPVSNNYRIQLIMTNNNDSLIIKSDPLTRVSEEFSLGTNTLLERETIK